MCISTVRQVPSDRLTYIFRTQILKEPFQCFLILVFNANKIKIAEFTQESMFMQRKPCAEIESEFDV